MTERKRLGHKFYMPKLDPKDNNFADFWSSLESDHNTVRTYYRIEFLRAIERIPEARKVLTDLQDKVLPNYDDAWREEEKRYALKGLDSLSLAEQCRSSLSPYGTALMEVLERYNLKADWILSVAIRTATVWSTARAENADIHLVWEWSLFDTNEDDPYDLKLISYNRHRLKLEVTIPHENEMTDSELTQYFRDLKDETVARRKQARQAGGWQLTPSKSALQLHAEYAVRYQVLKNSADAISETYGPNATSPDQDYVASNKRDIEREVDKFLTVIDLPKRPPARGYRQK